MYYINNITFSNCTLNFKWQVINATSNLHLSYIFFQTKLLNQFILLFKYVQNTCIHVQVEPTIWSPGSCPVALRLCGRLPDHLSYAVETTCNIMYLYNMYLYLNALYSTQKDWMQRWKDFWLTLCTLSLSYFRSCMPSIWQLTWQS